MKYLIRSIKYFIWFAIIFFICIVILVLTTDGVQLTEVFDPQKGLFKAGSLWKIIVFFAAVAAVYPSVGFVKKETFLNGTFDGRRDIIINILTESGYYIYLEEGESITFRPKKALTRFMRMYEGDIIMTKGESPIYLSGFRKDVYRLVSRIEFAIRKVDEENEENQNDAQ
jgi:hypothetical protein